MPPVVVQIVLHGLRDQLEFGAFQGYKGAKWRRQEDYNRKNLPRSPPPLGTADDLLRRLPQLHVADAAREVQRAERLVDVVGDRRDAAEHERFGILRDTILQ